MKNRPTKSTAGFTLMEVMVVVVILGILATLVIPRVIDRPDEARITKARMDISAIENAMNLYRLDNFKYPEEEGVAALIPKYLSRLPKDPWGKIYHVDVPGTHGEIDIYTLGPGGGDGDADGPSDNGEPGKSSTIGNWDLE